MREEARAALSLYARDYQATANPVFAWSALSRARRSGLAIPKWVMEYLERVAARVHVIARPKTRPVIQHRNGDVEIVRRPRDGNLQRVVYIALEFGAGRRGDPNPFTAVEDRAHDVNVAADVRRHVNAGLALDYALDEVARHHHEHCTYGPDRRCKPKNGKPSISRSTVARIFRRHRGELEAHPTTQGLINHTDRPDR